jgi:aconitate hydratase
MWFFPIDEITLGYLRLTGRKEDRIALVEAIVKNKAYGVIQVMNLYLPIRACLDMRTVEASLQEKRPQDRVALPDIPKLLVP